MMQPYLSLALFLPELLFQLFNPFSELLDQTLSVECFDCTLTSELLSNKNKALILLCVLNVFYKQVNEHYFDHQQLDLKYCAQV